MKKILPIVLALFAFPCPSRSQDLTRDQFFQNLRSVYYDPQKDGLKGFHCEVKSQLVDRMFSSGDLIENLFTFKLIPPFELWYDTKEFRLYPEKFQAPKGWAPMEKLDQYFGLLNELRTLIWGEIYGWSLFGYVPLESKGAPTGADLKKVADGYEVRLENSEGKGTVHFREDLALDRIAVKLKGMKMVTAQLTYEKKSKGLVLHSCQWDYKKDHYEAVVDYTYKDDYLVPQEIKTTFGDAGSKGVSIYDVLKFEKYHIDW